RECKYRGKIGLSIKITKAERHLFHVLFNHEKIILSPNGIIFDVRVPKHTVIANPEVMGYRNCNVDKLTVFGERSKVNYVDEEVR
ncbi:hypothetical protein ACLBO7_30090, partial [Klebsiella pneumoniae]